MIRITRLAAIRIGLPFLVLTMVTGLSACSATPGDVETEVSTEAAPAESSAPDEESNEKDVCALLSGVDTAALVGVEMSAGTNQGDTCLVEPVDSASSGSLQVQWVSSGGAARYTQQRELLGVSSEVSGFGDEAFLTGTWLLAVRGDEFLALQVVPDPLAPGERLTDAQVVAAAETVAFNAGW